MAPDLTTKPVTIHLHEGQLIFGEVAGRERLRRRRPVRRRGHPTSGNRTVDSFDLARLSFNICPQPVARRRSQQPTRLRIPLHSESPIRLLHKDCVSVESLKAIYGIGERAPTREGVRINDQPIGRRQSRRGRVSVAKTQNSPHGVEHQPIWKGSSSALSELTHRDSPQVDESAKIRSSLLSSLLLLPCQPGADCRQVIDSSLKVLKRLSVWICWIITKGVQLARSRLPGGANAGNMRTLREITWVDRLLLGSQRGSHQGENRNRPNDHY